MWNQPLMIVAIYFAITLCIGWMWSFATLYWL
jgi:hypothetical protein